MSTFLLSFSFCEKYYTLSFILFSQLKNFRQANAKTSIFAFLTF